MIRTQFQSCWVFSAREDAIVFVGPLLAAYALLGLAYTLSSGGQTLHTPYWIYALTVILVDQGHVCSTLFRTYFDRHELQRRKTLYLWTPLLCLLISVGLHQYSPRLFFQAFMYFNIYHLAKQQYGWMMYSLRREIGLSQFDRGLDKAMILNATFYPVLWWHLNDAGFIWRTGTPFLHLPQWQWLNTATWWGHWSFIALYILRQVYLSKILGRPVNLAKHLIWLTTWLVWFPSIVLSGSLFLFGMAVLLSHGIPYLLLVWRYGKRRWPTEEGGLTHLFGGRPGAVGYLLSIFLMGMLWQNSGQMLSGRSGLWGSFCTALLLLPSTVHYTLDGFIWKRSDPKNESLKEIVAS